MPKVALHTLGCKLNYAETLTIGRQFADRGYEIVELGEPADVCVINTCSVTARADRECRQIIRRALRSSGEPFVIVTGCYAQLRPEEVGSIDGVDLVLGAREKFNLFDFTGPMQKGRYPLIAVSDIGTVDSFGPASSTDAGNRTRAFLKVQDGCDFNCSFCTIPLARGSSRSQSIAACVDQAKDLASQGYREIVLTGVNVGDYGKKSGSSLLHLLHELVKVDGIDRLRISSIEPNLVSPEITRFVAENRKMCNHFHIPLQSGDDDILRRMRRRYTTAQYEALIHSIKDTIPDCGIGVDVITGFPGETEVHFERTYRFLHELPVTYLHVFTYSERPDTPAAQFAGAVEPRVRFRRNEMLRILGHKKRSAFSAAMVDKTVPVLMESDIEHNSRLGFTENYVRVRVPADETKENTMVPVDILHAEDGICVGRINRQREAA